MKITNKNNTINWIILISISFFLLFTGVYSIYLPNTEPCRVEGTITGDGINVEGLTVGAYEGNIFLNISSIIDSQGSYILDSIGSTNGTTISLKVYGHTFETFTFVERCKTNGNPWIIKDFTVSKVTNGGACNNNAICLSGFCSSGVCASAGSSGGGTPGGGSTGGGISDGGAGGVTNLTDEVVPPKSEYFISNSELNAGYTKWTYESEVLLFEVKSNNHKLTVESVLSDRVNVVVSSTPQRKTLFIGEKWAVDVDGDNVFDILVTLNDISVVDKGASISILSLEGVSEEELEQILTPEIKEDVKNYLDWKIVTWIISALIFIILIVFILVYFYKKR